MKIISKVGQCFKVHIPCSVKQAVYPTLYNFIPIFTNKRASFRGYRRIYNIHKDINYIHKQYSEI